MTVAELIEKLQKLGRPDMEVTSEYHLHDYIRTVQAVGVRHASVEEVYQDDKRTLIAGDDEKAEAYRRYGYTPREVIVIS
jgi:hypothetical protein